MDCLRKDPETDGADIWSLIWWHFISELRCCLWAINPTHTLTSSSTLDSVGFLPESYHIIMQKNGSLKVRGQCSHFILL